MRRIALGALMGLLTATAGGCGTLGQGNSAANRGVATRVEGAAAVPADEAPPGPKFARDAVPNSVMLQGQAPAGYHDSPVP